MKDLESGNFRPVVLITGCASGVGFALAKLLKTTEVYRVAATARPESAGNLKAQFKEDENFWVLPLEITSESQRMDVVKKIEARWGGVHVLVNNAGISYRSVVEHMTEADEFRQMSTNYLGPVGLIRLVLPHMREIGRGKIINVSSVSGMLAMPTMSSYSASKYALEGMSEALWYETKPLGISVSLIQPGFIRSSSFKRVYFTEKSRPEICVDGVYCDYYHYMEPFVEKLMNRSWATPEKVARLILKTMKKERPQLWIPATLDAWVFYYIRRLMPRRWLLPFLFSCLPSASLWGKAYTRKRRG
jgi:NAD(P)-dependent dehydrogenase (short-subunit alcohol dehydrogenase family)